MALVGTGFRHLAIELEKLVAYIGEKSQITRGAVESAASHLAESTIFMLVDAIGERRADQALRYLAEILLRIIGVYGVQSTLQPRAQVLAAIRSAR